MPRVRHLLLATVEDASDQKAWSGIPWSLRTALESQVERLTVFRPSRPSRHPYHVARRLLHGGEPPKYPLWMTPATLRRNARELQQQIGSVQPDAVLSISSQCIARLEETRVPVMMFSDAPWLAWHETYDGTISRPVLWQQYAAEERAAARRIAGVCFGSQWAVGEADRLYGPPVERRSRSFVTPLGANWVPQLSTEQVLDTAASRAHDRLELLYVGKDWERKGGPLAVEVARLLHERGTPVLLHIVGCVPALPAGAEAYTKVHGALYQTDHEQSMRLAALFLRSHFLLVPTTAECYGIVFAEAQAFALPPVSRAVQALPTVVQAGVTGLLLRADAPADAYVRRMLELRAQPESYLAMCRAARARYERELNWEACAAGILQAFASLPGAF